jgi:hypothetical protein
MNLQALDLRRAVPETEMQATTTCVDTEMLAPESGALVAQAIQSLRRGLDEPPLPGASPGNISMITAAQTTITAAWSGPRKPQIASKPCWGVSFSRWLFW